MFRLPNIPTIDASHPSQASTVEIADLWEILALQSEKGSTSLEAIKSILQLASNPDPDSDSEADIELEGLLFGVLTEIKDRLKSCGSALPIYPFNFRDTEVIISKPIEHGHYSYLFLLLATRLNMAQHRSHAGHDGTLLFEEVCEVALGNIFGSRRQTLRFGASKLGGGFGDRMQELCEALKDELKAKQNVSYQQDSGDDGLDIAAWMPFADERRGKHAIFAQCKTGSSWGIGDLRRLDPDMFCKLWMHPVPLVLPKRAFMSARRFEEANWEKSGYAELFFDRCRIMDHLQDMPKDLMKKIIEWVDAAMLSESFTMKVAKKSRPNRGRGQALA